MGQGYKGGAFCALRGHSSSPTEGLPSSGRDAGSLRHPCSERAGRPRPLLPPEASWCFPGPHPARMQMGRGGRPFGIELWQLEARAGSEGLWLGRWHAWLEQCFKVIWQLVGFYCKEVDVGIQMSLLSLVRGVCCRERKGGCDLGECQVLTGEMRWREGGTQPCKTCSLVLIVKENTFLISCYSKIRRTHIKFQFGSQQRRRRPVGEQNPAHTRHAQFPRTKPWKTFPQLGMMWPWDGHCLQRLFHRNWWVLFFIFTEFLGGDNG